MKPNWEDAPDWAEWLSEDGNGVWYWFATKPDWFREEPQFYLESRKDFMTEYRSKS